MQERARELPVRERDGPVELLSDIFDADFIYNHEELGWQAEDDGSTRFAFGLYYDGVNAVNPLGAFSGTHTLGMFYLQVYNLPQDKRQQQAYTFLVSAAYEHDVKYYGMEQCISGIIRNRDGSAV